MWESTTTYGNGSNKKTGNDTSVQLCGTSVCDINNIATDINYATFSVVTDSPPTGSGLIRPFLRFQHNEGDANGSATIERAFNTDNTDIGTIQDVLANGDPDGDAYDNQAKDSTAGPGDDFNHAIKYSELMAALENPDGTFSDEINFFLDINEPNAEGPLKNLLRLDELALFVSGDNMLNEFQRDAPGTTAGTTLATATFLDGDVQKVWDMDYNEICPDGTSGTGSCNQNWGGLLLDNLNDSPGGGGSGDYDVQMTLKKQLFDEAIAKLNLAEGQEAYVYLYNWAGDADNYTANGNNDGTGPAEAGFEEWAVSTASVPDDEPPGGNTPEPGTALLILGGLMGMTRLCRRRPV